MTRWRKWRSLPLRALRVPQSRNRDAVSEVTNRIADACLQCHDVYRGKPGGTTIDPSNKAARCAP